MPIGIYKRTDYHKKIAIKNLGDSHKRVGELNPVWKGDKAQYCSLHDWVNYHKGKANWCMLKGYFHKECSKRFEWASISHEAKRDLDDFIPLCVRHHRLFDGNMPKPNHNPELDKKISESVKKNWELRRIKYGAKGRSL